MAGYRRRRAHARRIKRYALLTAGSVLIVSIVIVFAALAARGGSGGSSRSAQLPSPTLVAIETAYVTQETTWSPSASAPGAATPEPSAAPELSATPGTATAAPTTAEPTAQATAQATPTVDPDVLQLTADDYLPIYKKADTDQKIIAVTVDDLYQTENAKKIIDLTLHQGGKLTLFPIGKNAIRPELSKVLRDAHGKGIEIENHTYEHKGLYGLDDVAMARQVYLQSLAVDYALGAEYQEHFFRPYGGDGLTDQRTHLYAKQLGMRGIAYWSVSGSDTAADKLVGTLAPGNVYLFHTTDADTKKLEAFIPAAVKAGYKLVTLNELFGLPDNETAELTKPIRDHEIPPITKYRLAPRDYKKGDYIWEVNLIQQRLVQLNYLEATPDGVYGDATVDAIKLFQANSGLTATGVADPDTQNALFSPDAKAKQGA